MCHAELNGRYTLNLKGCELNTCGIFTGITNECATRWNKIMTYLGADNSLARPGRKQAWKHVRDARDFNRIETRAVIKFLFLQGKAPKEIHAILTETLACFLPGRAKDLSAPLHISQESR